MKSLLLFIFTLAPFIILSCNSRPSGDQGKSVTVGALKLSEYLPLLDGKSVAIVANQTSMAGRVHLVDTLLSQGVHVRHIFAPEHGFRDLAPAGDKISDSRDPVTGTKIISLYGSHLQPTAGDLDSIDVVLFDIQDVGTRFYTYISTMTLVMESCAANGVKFIVLDRPNPNGFLVDGNILDTAYSSFVGMHPVPVSHGMTVGEYAQMVNGEGWLRGGIKCDLTVIKCDNWDHSSYYELPVMPSPNLPNQTAIYLYPSICFFEGTDVSCGRGTGFPFQAFGSPSLPDRGFSFTPEVTAASSRPPHIGELCYGTDLRNVIKEGIVPAKNLNLSWVIGAYNDYPDKEKFFTKYFDTLAGGPLLREQIIAGMTAGQIRETWKPGLERFSGIRGKYLLYD